MAQEVDEFALVRAYARKALEKLPYEPGNYPYVAARAKAKKARLLPGDVYAKLLQMEIPQIARLIGEGEYKGEVLALGAKVRGVDLIERATAANLAEVFTQIIKMSEGRLRTMVGAYLDRWDVANIKTVIRGKLYGASAADVLEDIVAAGSLDADFLQTLVEWETVDDVFAALEGTFYGDARRQMPEGFDPAKDMAAYEDALAHLYYRRLLASVIPNTEASRFFLEFVRREIDILNVKTLLRVWKAKAKLDRPIFLQGGLELTPEELQEMVGLDANALLARFAGTSFREDIAGALREIDTRGVAGVERALEKVHLKQASRYAHLHPLSVLPVLDYLARKTREVENIRIVARGKEHGIATEAIRELLVI